MLSVGNFTTLGWDTSFIEERSRPFLNFVEHLNKLQECQVSVPNSVTITEAPKKAEPK